MLFASTVTLAALSFLVYATDRSTGVSVGSGLDGVVRVLPFAFFAVLTRLLSFRILVARVSLDTAIFVAAAFVLGGLPAAWLVVGTIVSFEVLRLPVDREGEERSGAGTGLLLLRAVFAGAVSAALLLGASMVLGLEGHKPSGSLARDLGKLWQVPAFFLLWLPLQYLIVGISYRLLGLPWSRILAKALLPAFAAETALVPLATLMVLVYDARNPLELILLSCLSIVFIFVLRRLTWTRERLVERVHELEVLNRLGQTMASTMDPDHLADRIAESALSIYDSADTVILARRDEGKHLQVHAYDGEGRRRDAVDTEPLIGWILDTGSEVQGNHGPQTPERVDASRWLGVPIISYGEVAGALLVRVDQADTFDRGRMRLLQLISRQAAVALRSSSLYELATRDGLTDLYVRRYFDQRLEEELQRARRYSKAFSVLLLDVDDFKAINDNFLHQTGDQVLQMVAAVIRDWIRGLDVPCRIGGDEFAVILPETTEAEAARVAERIREGVRHLSIASLGRAVSVTVSVGVASFPECRARTAKELREKADVALYWAKSERGKNKVQAWRDLEATAGDLRRPRGRTDDERGAPGASTPEGR